MKPVKTDQPYRTPIENRRSKKEEEVGVDLKSKVCYFKHG
jgi:hypothetical protein